MSRINATTITGLSGAAPTFTNGVVVTGVGYINGNLGIGTTNPTKPLHIYTADGDIRFGDITDGTGSTDAGIIFTGLGTVTSALFTEVNGEILSYGINSEQIIGIQTARAGGIFRLDTRNAGSYADANCFVVKARPIGTSTEYNALVVGLNDGNTYLSPVRGNVGIGTTNPLSRLTVVGGESRFGGVIETVSAATTYNSAAGALVLEMDVRQATTYTYTIPTGANIGIVSFKNMPAPTGNSSGTTITCILTQNAAGTGNTTAATGIGTNCTVIGYENGAAVAGISTRALVGSGTSLTLSTTASDRDFVSFFVNYTGASNTTASSYQVYVTKNGGFR
jgi:hypothetical protein